MVRQKFRSFSGLRVCWSRRCKHRDVQLSQATVSPFVLMSQCRYGWGPKSYSSNQRSSNSITLLRLQNMNLDPTPTVARHLYTRIRECQRRVSSCVKNHDSNWGAHQLQLLLHDARGSMCHLPTYLVHTINTVVLVPHLIRYLSCLLMFVLEWATPLFNSAHVHTCSTVCTYVCSLASDYVFHDSVTTSANSFRSLHLHP